MQIARPFRGDPAAGKRNLLPNSVRSAGFDQLSDNFGQQDGRVASRWQFEF